MLLHTNVGTHRNYRSENQTDYLSDMDVYWDSRQGKKNLPFLEKFSESEYIKI